MVLRQSRVDKIPRHVGGEQDELALPLERSPLRFVGEVEGLSLCPRSGRGDLQEERGNILVPDS